MLILQSTDRVIISIFKLEPRKDKSLKSVMHGQCDGYHPSGKVSLTVS